MNDSVMPPGLIPDDEAFREALLVISFEYLSDEEYDLTLDIIKTLTQRCDIDFRLEKVSMTDFVMYDIAVSVSVKDMHYLRYLFARDFDDNLDLEIVPEYGDARRMIYVFNFRSLDNVVEDTKRCLEDFISRQDVQRTNWGCL